MHKKNLLLFCLLWIGSLSANDWTLGPFMRVNEGNSVIAPRESTCHCPLKGQDVFWEDGSTSHPAAVMRNGKVYLLYQAEGTSGFTSRIGLAFSDDGVHFKRHPIPVLFPSRGRQRQFESPGGCEDPRIVEREVGQYVMTYTQRNETNARLAIATSDNLVHWRKHGPAFKEDLGSNSGSIVCEVADDHLIAAKIEGKYWMYWGAGTLYLASSKDLIHWEPQMTEEGSLQVILAKSEDAFIEPGPPAILTEQGILLLYNEKNATGGQVLFSAENPTQVLERDASCFLTPVKEKEGTAYLQGLVPFRGKWHLYYGVANKVISVATTR